MINKVKNYGLIVLGIFLLILAAQNRIQSKRIANREADIARLEGNQIQLLDDAKQQTVLYLTEKERTVKLNRTVDSLAKALKIKPKQVDKIIYIENTTRDTVKISVPTDLIEKDYWYIQDSSKCFKWAGNAYLMAGELNVERTLFEYNNRTTEVFYRKRPHKFLFIHYGKWQNLQEISSECGSVQVKTFNFIK